MKAFKGHSTECPFFINTIGVGQGVMGDPKMRFTIKIRIIVG